MVTIDAGKFKRCENGKILLKRKKERMFHASCISTNAIKVAYITEIIFTYVYIMNNTRWFGWNIISQYFIIDIFKKAYFMNSAIDSVNSVTPCLSPAPKQAIKQWTSIYPIIWSSIWVRQMSCRSLNLSPTDTSVANLKHMIIECIHIVKTLSKSQSVDTAL